MRDHLLSDFSTKFSYVHITCIKLRFTVIDNRLVAAKGEKRNNPSSSLFLKTIQGLIETFRMGTKRGIRVHLT